MLNKKSNTLSEFDYIIVGSGFGGSVSALRLSEKGYNVAVLEQGKRQSDEDLAAAGQEFTKLNWLPKLGMKGFLSQDLFKHITLVRGVAYGGGSIVYASVLLEPKKPFFEDEQWRHLGDWEQDLLPHYETAKRMLGRTEAKYYGNQDDVLATAANSLGEYAQKSFGRTTVGIFFGEQAGEEVDDPFFDGKGPKRTGCVGCGECMAGCQYNAKNSLDKNYLYMAEQLGCQMFTECKVTRIIPQKAQDGSDCYTVEVVSPFRWGEKVIKRFTAKNVVISAGVLGTIDLLYRNRDVYKTLPNISQELGNKVRTNSEAFTMAYSEDDEADMTQGIGISSHFYADENTHITQNRFAKSYNFMRFYAGPMISDNRPLIRALKTFWAYLRHPLRATSTWRLKDVHKRVVWLTVMQSVDNYLKISYKRKWFKGFSRGMGTELAEGGRVPAYIEHANSAGEAIAEAMGVEPRNLVMETVANISSTAHMLGGAPMGANHAEGVINARHEVFGYPGLYVVDGSAIPANVGVNPSLTITALSELAMSRIPPKAEGHAEQ